MTSTVDPGSTLAVLTTAPTPVITAQPTTAAMGIGTSSGIFSTACSAQTVCSAKHDTPAKCRISRSFRRSRLVPSARSPLPRMTVPTGQSAGLPTLQYSQ